MMMTARSDEQLVDVLQEHLHSARGPKPRREIVMAAMALARNDTLTIAKACNDAGVPVGSRSRAAQFGKRIRDENLLARFALEFSHNESPPPPPSPSSRPQSWLSLYPDQKVPCCPDCDRECELRVIEPPLSCACSVCGCALPSNQQLNLYWMIRCSEPSWNLGVRSASSCSRQYYLLCHACTRPKARLDWTDPKLLDAVLACADAPRIEFAFGLNEVRHNAEDLPEYWDALEDPEDFTDLSESASEDFETLRALHLPANHPYLFTPKVWIASNARRLWQLNLNELHVSADGTQVAREVTAIHKITSLEDRALWVQWFTSIDDADRPEQLEKYYVTDQITYDFPPAECSHDPLALQRYKEKMRQREKSTIIALDLALDESAANAHRAAKSELKRQQRHGEMMVLKGVIESMITRLENIEQQERSAALRLPTMPAQCTATVTQDAGVCQRQSTQASHSGMVQDPSCSTRWCTIRIRDDNKARAKVSASGDIEIWRIHQDDVRARYNRDTAEMVRSIRSGATDVNELDERTLVRIEAYERRLNLRVGDLIWIQPADDAKRFHDLLRWERSHNNWRDISHRPAGEASGWQLAALGRFKSGGRVDVQLCDPIPHGHGGCERVAMRQWRFNLPPSAIFGPVVPFMIRCTIAPERWSPFQPPVPTAGLQLHQAMLMADNEFMVAYRCADDLRRGAGEKRMSIESILTPGQVPRLSELAMRALPEFFFWEHLRSGPFPKMEKRTKNLHEEQSVWGNRPSCERYVSRITPTDRACIE